MPWKATDAMKERVSFVLEWERRWNEAQGGRVDLAELCRKYGVSRPTGYAWVKRFRDAGHDLRAVEEKSRRPLANPHAISPAVEDLVVQARKLMPRRGPRKLRAILLDRYPEVEWPSTSSIGNILRRRGLCQVRKLRRRAPPMTQPFAQTLAPNDTWCIDFKGKFRMQDGNGCHVLTLLDADTRYLLRAEPMLDPTGDNVEAVLDSAFQEFGLPKALRLRQRPAVCLDRRRTIVAPLCLVAEARDRAGAHRARQAAAERTSRALPPLLRGSRDASGSKSRRAAPRRRRVAARLQRGAAA